MIESALRTTTSMLSPNRGAFDEFFFLFSRYRLWFRPEVFHRVPNVCLAPSEIPLSAYRTLANRRESSISGAWLIGTFAYNFLIADILIIFILLLFYWLRNKRSTSAAVAITHLTHETCGMTKTMCNSTEKVSYICQRNLRPKVPASQMFYTK